MARSIVIPEAMSRVDPSLQTSVIQSIRFHVKCQQNIGLSADSRIASRNDRSDSYGVCFSDRPINVNEKIRFRFKQLSPNGGASTWFGFTAFDPNRYRINAGLPRNWSVKLLHTLAVEGEVISCHVTQSGDVYFGINGEERGKLFGGIDTSRPLWAIFNLFRSITEIELIYPSEPVNSRRFFGEFDSITSRLSSIDINSRVRETQVPLNREQNCESFAFHSTKGSNIQLFNRRRIAERINNNYSQGYVFGERPLSSGQKLAIRILQINSFCDQSLAFGLTSCDPITINSSQLPGDPNQLMERPEYWNVVKDVINGSQSGDVFTFDIRTNGRVFMAKNREAANTLMRVNSSQHLWPFFDLCGSTTKIKILDPNNIQFLQNVGQSLQLTDQTNVRQTNRIQITAPRLRNTQVRGNTDESDVCKVCLDQRMNCIVLDCGHISMCFFCADIIRRQTGLCPICRAAIRDIKRIYKS